MRRQGTYVFFCFFFLVVQWYAYSSFWKIMTCISSYTHLFTTATTYKMFSGIRGNFVFIEPQGINGTGDLCRVCAGCPQQRYIPGEPGNIQGRNHVGIVEWSCGYRARGVSIRGKFVLSRNPGYKTRGRHVAKRSSDLRVAYPEVNVQVRDLVWVVDIVAPFALRVFSIQGNVLSIGQAKSSLPALSYFQVRGIKHDQELYAKVSYILSAYSSVRRKLYADL